ncbi:hypothetical protein RHSIM_Rhsim08G0031900 [Rhododendron simsii]|uniref:HMA domain-containing protein n=1 Tax=Rhododendron simsii TaxID=118357 RepID=A0A834GIT1_RHOSS|nr:hypothetical protein RHSIM_Rhsim08G0031900 [Rhododendron simsii]
MGVIDDILIRCPPIYRRKKLKRNKQLQTVEIRIKMDCHGCERKVRKSVEGMKGVSQIEVDPKQHKLTVIGYVDPKKVLKRVRHKTGKKAEMWPYVPFDVVDHPYVQGVYDRKAPPGYVRNVELVPDPQITRLARASSTEVKYITAFSDDNPTGCSVM